MDPVTPGRPSALGMGVFEVVKGKQIRLDALADKAEKQQKLQVYLTEG
jgi:hypothetical protein